MSALKNNKELQVAAIENGTVIDHIPPTELFKVATLLELDKMEATITIANNLPLPLSRRTSSSISSATTKWSRRNASRSPTNSSGW